MRRGVGIDLARWWPPVRLGLTLIGVAWVIAIVMVRTGDGFAWDARAYWLTRSGDLYATASVTDKYAYLYSPAFAQVISPLTALDWQSFLVLWTALQGAALVAVAGPLTLPVLLTEPGLLELDLANIHFMLALAVVASFRWPAAWAFVILTKVTPGIGVLWFAFRREWRSFAIALGVTAAIVAVSFVIAPDAWRRWFEVVPSHDPTPGFDIPLLVRLPLAVLLLWWGARSDRKWVVPIVVLLALPTIRVFALPMLVAVVPLAFPGATITRWNTVRVRRAWVTAPRRLSGRYDRALSSQAAPRSIGSMRLSFDRLWVVIALSLPALIALVAAMPAVDLAYQVRAGDEILATRALPGVDSWTFTVAGEPWLDQQWLAQVILSVVHGIGGWELLAVLRAGVIVVAFGLLLAAGVSRGAPVNVAAILSLVAFLLSATALALRPQLFGILAFASLLYLVAARDRRPRLYLVAPLVVVLWANLHGSFVLAPLVLGYAVVEDLARRRPWRRSLLVLLAGTAATLVNPFGLGAWAYAANIGTNPLIAGQISEWQRTSPLTVPGALFYASVVAAFGLLLVRRRDRGRVTIADCALAARLGRDRRMDRPRARLVAVGGGIRGGAGGHPCRSRPRSRHVVGRARTRSMRSLRSCSVCSSWSPCRGGDPLTRSPAASGCCRTRRRASRRRWRGRSQPAVACSRSRRGRPGSSGRSRTRATTSTPASSSSPRRSSRDTGGRSRAARRPSPSLRPGRSRSSSSRRGARSPRRSTAQGGGAASRMPMASCSRGHSTRRACPRACGPCVT